jgi:hypothetical protein
MLLMVNLSGIRSITIEVKSCVLAIHELDEQPKDAAHIPAPHLMKLDVFAPDVSR